MRRFTRLTNAFSKKVENHHFAVSLSLHVLQLCARASDAKMTPAQAAGVTTTRWTLEDIVGLLDSEVSK